VARLKERAVTHAHVASSRSLATRSRTGPQRDLLVRRVADGLSDGTVTLADINELTDDETQALLTARTRA
jgi:hypothetical protein